MTKLVILIGIAFVAVGLAVYGFDSGNKRKDKPGPHNNWRKNASADRSPGFTENFPGSGTDGLSGGAD